MQPKTERTKDRRALDFSPRKDRLHPEFMRTTQKLQQPGRKCYRDGCSAESPALNEPEGVCRCRTSGPARSPGAETARRARQRATMRRPPWLGSPRRFQPPTGQRPPLAGGKIGNIAGSVARTRRSAPRAGHCRADGRGSPGCQPPRKHGKDVVDLFRRQFAWNGLRTVKTLSRGC